MLKNTRTITSVFSFFIALFVIALPVLAQGADSTIDEQIDYDTWYQITADTIGVEVAELTQSTDSIGRIARVNGIAPSDVISAIFSAEEEELTQLESNGQITADQNEVRRNEVRSEVNAFVRTASPDFTTDVATQEAQWSGLELNTYEYTLNRICECIDVPQYTISVVDGEVVTVTAVDGNLMQAVLQDDGSFATVPVLIEYDPSGFRTLDEWFVYVADEQAEQPPFLRAEYDATLGYLTSIYIDHNQMIADEESIYRIALLQEDATDSTIDEQIDYDAWYQIAADIIGVEVAELTQSTDSIRSIARVNSIAPSAVINAIFSAERAELNQLRRNGQITADQYRVRRNEVRSEVNAFVRTASPDFTTDVATQEAQWSGLELNTYKYTLDRICECIDVPQYTISVVDGEVVTVTAVDESIVSIILEDDGSFTEVPVIIDFDPSGFRTLDEWFVYVADEQAEQPPFLRAEYDATLGYLTSIYIDHNQMIADEESIYTITLLQE